MENRVKNLEKRLLQDELDGLIISNQKNIYYLTGFWGTEATVFIGPKHRLFLTDARYTLIAKELVKGFDIIETRTPLETLANLLAEQGLSRIGFDTEVSYRYHNYLVALMTKERLVPTTQLVEGLRMIKDKNEIETIRQACQISDQAFLDSLAFIKPNKTTELELMHFLDHRMRLLGAEGASFEFIIASGYRSAMPHGVASDKVIKSGETLTMDFGCYYKHYASDMTRTIHIGQVTDEEREIYQTVLAANKALIDRAKAGVTYREYDSIPRKVIDQAGYGAYFTHGIGHGLGLDIHEEPYFGKSDDEIKAGMILTDEPGIYLEGKYGVRIEDDLLITDTGCEVLTLAPKELIVL